jgi:uncharacterized protein (DUF2164 family)
MQHLGDAMAIELSRDEQQQALASMRRFADSELDVELSDIQLMALLQYVLKEIAPSVRNQTLADAQVFLRERLADMEASLYEPEFAWWPKGSSVRRK